jgi:hypothetical protein
MGVWAVEGGAATPEDARAALHKATAGNRGVALPGDLKVTALPVAGTSVRVAPGGASLPSRYPGGAGESYGTLMKASEDVPVPATGSGAGAVRYLIQRITDPQFEGQPPADPITHRYDSFVWVDSITNLTYPYVELARLDQPPSTATITNGMLTDIRKLAQPRMKQDTLMGGPTADQAMTASGGAQWPDYRPTILVPDWATDVSIVATIASAGYMAGSVNGILAATLGTAGPTQFRSANTIYDLDIAVNDGQRQTLIVGGKGKIDQALRGTTQTLGLEASRLAGSGYLITRTGTHVIYQVTFTEESV